MLTRLAADGNIPGNLFTGDVFSIVTAFQAGRILEDILRS